MRTCTKCGETKHHSHFYRRKGRLQSWCKDCEIEKATEWKRRNPEKSRDAVRRFRQRNPGYDLPQQAAYRAALAELRERHLDEFERLYRKHKRRSA